MPLIHVSPPFIRSILPKIDPVYMLSIDRHWQQLDAAGITDSRFRLACAMALWSFLTDGMSKLRENLDLSADEINTAWPGRFTAEDLPTLVNNPTALGNALYSPNQGDLGNTAGPDGYTYCARGLMWLRGRAEYGSICDVNGLLHHDFLANPDSVCSADFAVPVAVYLWDAIGANTLVDENRFDELLERSLPAGELNYYIVAGTDAEVRANYRAQYNDHLAPWVTALQCSPPQS